MFLIFTIIVHFVVRKIKPQDPHLSPTQPLSWEGRSAALGSEPEACCWWCPVGLALQPAVPAFCRLPLGAILL